jgi:hypothetical protein
MFADKANSLFCNYLKNNDVHIINSIDIILEVYPCPMKVIRNQLLIHYSDLEREFFTAIWCKKLISFFGAGRIEKTGSFYSGKRAEKSRINKNNYAQLIGNKSIGLGATLIRQIKGWKSGQVKGNRMLSSGDLLQPESRGNSLFLTSLPPLKGKRPSILSSMLQEAGCIAI